MASVPSGSAVAAPAGAGAAQAGSDEKGWFIFYKFELFLSYPIYLIYLTLIFIANKKEEKKEESDNESEDDDMGFGLFD